MMSDVYKTVKKGKWLSDLSCLNEDFERLLRLEMMSFVIRHWSVVILKFCILHFSFFISLTHCPRPDRKISTNSSPGAMPPSSSHGIDLQKLPGVCYEGRANQKYISYCINFLKKSTEALKPTWEF